MKLHYLENYLITLLDITNFLPVCWINGRKCLTADRIYPLIIDKNLKQTKTYNQSLDTCIHICLKYLRKWKCQRENCLIHYLCVFDLWFTKRWWYPCHFPILYLLTEYWPAHNQRIPNVSTFSHGVAWN
jgi:hypothetical protein